MSELHPRNVSPYHPVDLTGPPYLAVRGWSPQLRARVRAEILAAANDLLMKVQQECIGSVEVVDIRDLRLCGAIEQNGALASQRGFIAIQAGPMSEQRRARELDWIVSTIWGEWLRELESGS